MIPHTKQELEEGTTEEPEVLETAGADEKTTDVSVPAETTPKEEAPAEPQIKRMQEAQVPQEERPTEEIKNVPEVKASRKVLAKQSIGIEQMDVYAMFLLEDIFPHRARHGFLRFFGILLIIFFLVAVISILFTILHVSSLPVSDEMFRSIAKRSSGLLFIAFACWAVVYMVEAFYRSLYYHNREHKAKATGKRDRIVSEVIEYFHAEPSGDILRAFLTSSLGSKAMARLGIQKKEIEEFLRVRTETTTVSFYEIEQKNIIDREELGVYLFDKYNEFSQFLFRHNISKEIYAGALTWMIELDLGEKFKERWWSKDRLENFPGFGGTWSYGKAFTLAKYGRDLGGFLGDEGSADYIGRRAQYVEELETILSKQREANALLVGENGVGIMDIMHDIARRVATGRTTPELMDKRLVLLDTELLISTSQGKNDFEVEFMRVLSDAEGAGNIALIFDDFAGFLESARAEGVDALSLLNKYLDSPALQVIALSDKEKYHQFLETNSLVASRFEVVTVEEPGFQSIIGILENMALSLERQYGIFFTYPGLLEVAKSAKYYITEGVMPDKAMDLLVEMAPRARDAKDTFITKESVQAFVSEKTHIPMGTISEEESSGLENLEGSLHRLVIGQEKAIDALSNALRRSRAGLRDLERPIGSFLFLGPTGVGKTQTAKAIAEVYFGDKNALSRLDMSEYSGQDALLRLTGSFESGKVGTLTTIIKSRPYGVLLLDELEKAHREVHDLFLQVLDEGFFSDMGGRKVIARNLIFIATSNAGSDKIFAASEAGRDVSEMKDELIAFAIESGIYRPEFLNRFDDVIVFHPLSREHIREVAKLMLADTKRRIKAQGYELLINDPLIDFTVEKGFDPAFGARPMERAIKDTVEEVIAKRIISGSLHQGDTITLSEEDFRDDHETTSVPSGKDIHTPLSY